MAPTGKRFVIMMVVIMSVTPEPEVVRHVVFAMHALYRGQQAIGNRQGLFMNHPGSKCDPDSYRIERTGAQRGFRMRISA